jgi:thiamine biosynthesis protein ThiI
MKKIILRYGEIYLKGNNQKQFKKQLVTNIKTALQGEQYTLETTQARYIISTPEGNEQNILHKLRFVFGLVSFSVAQEVLSTPQEIEDYVKTLKINTQTFRVSVNRADKTFPIKSIDYERFLGGLVLKNNNHLKVDLTNPQTHVQVDIRENGKTYIYFENIAGAGGLPLNTAGRGLLLLSGGIDSPVAAYEIAKRGMYLEAVHFHSYPYTSEQAKQKVIELGKAISNFNPRFKIHFVSITKLQEEINKNCNPNYMIAIMRRFMYRIAERIAAERDIQAIVTGENLGQVASQTVESLTSTNSVLQNIIALRPLIAFDKNEIVKIAEKIGTYDISIFPYEDCCTVFLPKNPVIKPKLKEVIHQEQKLDLDALLEQSLATKETVVL